ncbi:transposase [Leptolyngbya sp. 15MV]|nr:transposase [Leptolyngbya sp. 15MV]
MTELEWSALAVYVTHRTGRPPRDPRATWDAIFWVACSTAPWAALPPGLGRPETAHSALIHTARIGVLDRLLVAVSGHPLAPDGILTLRRRVCRAVRRASRQLRPETILLARSLGLTEALYCDLALLPDLSKFDPARPSQDHLLANERRCPSFRLT